MSPGKGPFFLKAKGSSLPTTIFKGTAVSFWRAVWSAMEPLTIKKIEGNQIKKSDPSPFPFKATSKLKGSG